MDRLGYQKFVIQGGNWGSVIGRAAAVLYPERVMGYHSNTPMADVDLMSLLRLLSASAVPGFLVQDPALVGAKKRPVSYWIGLLKNELGHLHMAATKPDTIGIALNNDPVGLAAFILEKVSTWTNEAYRRRHDGGMHPKFSQFSYTDLLTNVMIYWINGNITSSLRLFKEQANSIDVGSLAPVTVPTGLFYAANDPFAQPISLLRESLVNIVHVKHRFGVGHFLAMEAPNIFATELIAFVGQCRLLQQQATS